MQRNRACPRRDYVGAVFQGSGGRTVLVRPPRLPDRVGVQTSTVLFTDLVASTETWFELGDHRANDVRRIHDRILAHAVNDNGGFVVKGRGDGIHATFASASSAVDCAVQIHRQLSEHRGLLAIELQIRIGISAGDVIWDLTGGRPDCYGIAVIEAARLEAIARPNEILCSDLVRQLARGRTHHQIEPVGAVDLRGFPQPVLAARVVSSSGSIHREKGTRFAIGDESEAV